MHNIKCGSYGCVIKPYIGCEGKKYESGNNEYITKVFGDKEAWSSEIELNNLIKDIDPQNKFTVKMVDFCNGNHEIYKLSNITTSFNSIVGYYKKYQIVYEYGGEDLDNILDKKTYILSPEFDIISFLKSFINIFDGFIELNKKGLIHFDIKLDNILYDEKNNKFSLIDFGLMKKKEEIYTTNVLKHFFDKKYYYYPSELNIFSYMVFKQSGDIKKELLNVTNAIIKFNRLYQSFKHNHEITKIHKEIVDVISNIEKQLMNYKNYLSTFNPLIKKMYSTQNKYTTNISKLIQEDYKKICIDKANDIVSKIDIYMLGITLFFLLLEIIKLLAEHKQFTKINKIPPTLFHLIKKMINMNPCQRIGIKRARDEYKKILNI